MEQRGCVATSANSGVIAAQALGSSESRILHRPRASRSKQLVEWNTVDHFIFRGVGPLVLHALTNFLVYEALREFISGDQLGENEPNSNELHPPNDRDMSSSSLEVFTKFHKRPLHQPRLPSPWPLRSHVQE